MMNKQKKFDDILNNLNIPKEHHQNVNELLLDFVNDIMKEEFLKELPKDDFDIIGQSISCISHICPPELEELKTTKEYTQIYTLLIQSKEIGKIDNKLIEIYEYNKNLTKKLLLNKKTELEKTILGKQYKNYFKIKESLPEKAKVILDKNLSKSNEKLIKKYNLISKELEYFEYSPLVLKLNDNTLKLNIKDDDIFSYITFLILKPVHQLFCYFDLDNNWDNFPLKWYILNQSVSLGKSLLYYYNQGIDISSYLTDKYKENDFEELNTLLKSNYLSPPASHILCSRKESILEIINCYKNSMYSACICLCFTLIEGITWDFTIYLQETKKLIYNDTTYSSIKTLNGNILRNPTIGDMINQTYLNSIFDDTFIKYFCEELYNERNPVLHGRETQKFNKENASKKLATLEYIITTIESYIKNQFKENMKNNIPKEVKERIYQSIKTAKGIKSL